MPDTLHQWIDELSAALELDPSTVDVRAVLDLARDAAHGVARPAAPVTTFLVGLAAGRAGGDADAMRTATATASRLAAAHRPPPDDPTAESR